MKIPFPIAVASVVVLQITSIIAPAKAQLPPRPQASPPSTYLNPQPLVEFRNDPRDSSTHADFPAVTMEPTVIAPEAALPTPAPAPVAAMPRKPSYTKCHVEGTHLAMTFDDGPHPTLTPRLLDILKERGIKATFYVIGKNVATYPEIVQRMVAEGHEIGNHTYNHPSLTKVSPSKLAEEIQQANAAIEQAVGIKPATMRPPYGATNAAVTKRLNEEFGFSVIMWSVDPQDWKIRKASHVSSHIIQNSASGSIVLAHDIHPSTIDAMPAALDALIAKGHKFATVSELIAMDRPQAATLKTPASAPQQRPRQQ